MPGSWGRARREKLRMQLFIRQFALCHWCGVPMSLQERHRTGNNNIYATLDHVVKKEDGGTLYYTNVVLAHGKCNASRHSPVVFAKRIERMRKNATMIARECECSI